MKLYLRGVTTIGLWLNFFLAAIAWGRVQIENPKATVETSRHVDIFDPRSPEYTWAVGFSPNWQFRKDYGARYYRRFWPEIMGYAYAPSPIDALYHRFGAKIGYSNDQPEMPSGVQFVETDYSYSVDYGIVYSWLICPSVSFGMGIDDRTTKVKAAPPIDSVDDRLDHKSKHRYWYVQSGLGLPFWDGRLLAEPTLRYQSVTLDNRVKWAIGFETTYGF
jgi:hypothetical protein